MSPVQIPLLGEKYACVVRALGPDVRTLLDVGCRDARLKQYLDPRIRYTGLDLSPGPGVDVVCDVEEGMPFRDRAFDAVVALDVLEHTDDIWFVFAELARTARRQIAVIFPNMYHWTLRLKYLCGIEAGKYRLPSGPITDRHRWLVSYRTARAFCQEMARKHALDCQLTVIFRGRRYLVTDIPLSLVWPNLAAWAVMCVFTVRSADGGPGSAP